mgnify:FL=1
MARQSYTPTKSSAVSNTAKKSSPKKSSSTEKLDVDKNTSASIRKIENGYIVSESGYTGKGRNQQYFSREYFSTENPVANVKIQFGKKK